MKSETLNYLVNKLIIPDNPIIKDFVWHKNHSSDNNSDYWSLELILDPESNVSYEEMEQLRKDVEEEMSDLFNMISPPKDQKFLAIFVSKNYYERKIRKHS